MKKKIVLLSISILLIISLIFINSKPKETIYVNEDNLEELMKNTLAVYTENSNGSYDKSTTIPGINDGYTFDYDKSMCEGTATISWNNESWGAEISNVNKEDTKCYLYFRVKMKVVNTVLGNITVNYERPDFSKTATTDEGIHMALDDDGESYYYRGAVDNNWVRFAGYYWRIIRINGNGSLRMIYSGVDSGSITDDNITGEGTQIGTSAFNENYDDNAYVGYQYTIGEVHGTGNDSTIKGVLDNWYNNNLSSYANYISVGNDSTFCNDRQPSTSNSSLNGSGGTGTTTTYYAVYMRLYKGDSASSAVPSFKCLDRGDAFSTSIGLVTADEASYAGGVYPIANSSYYLYTSQIYWTMSPFYFSSIISYASMFRVYSDGTLGSDWVNGAWGVRPVINLRSDVTITGNGTSTDPYVVS